MTRLRLLSLVLHAVVALCLLPPLRAFAGLPAAAALAVWLVASTVLLPLSLNTRHRQAGQGAVVLAWASLGAMGLFSSLFVLTVLRQVLLGLAWLATQAGASALASGPAAALAGPGAAAVPLLALALTAWGLYNARRPARVKRVEVPLQGLPPALHGFRIAQLSDVHVGPTIQGAWLRPLVARVNALQADVVAITGDLVDGSVRDLAPHVAELAALRSRHGTFFVTGNHEYYSGAASWIAELRRLGVTVLMNEHVVLQHPSPQAPAHAPLVLAGVADWSAHHFDPAHRSDPRRAAAGAPAGAPKVLLAHQPRSAEAAAQAGFDLQLSGHTHGGQFLPWNFFVPLQQPFVAGLHAVQRMWLYVSRGTGYWGPPKRLGAPSEITELVLVPA